MSPSAPTRGGAATETDDDDNNNNNNNAPPHGAGAGAGAGAGYGAGAGAEAGAPQEGGNLDAERALMRVAQKLDGYEGSELRSVEGRVQQLLQDGKTRAVRHVPGWATALIGCGCGCGCGFDWISHDVRRYIYKRTTSISLVWQQTTLARVMYCTRLFLF